MADQSQASDFSDVFISYRRKDVEFVKELVAGIQATGKEVWVDWEDIPPGSVGFTDDIQRGLEGSDAFIAVLSPDYLESEYCVELELQTAINLNKRIIPVVYRKFDGYDIPLGIGHINWIYFTPHAGQENTYEESLPKVLHALEADFEHMRAHKRFLLRAIEWDKNERRNSFLLTGDEINEAEEWLSDASGKDPVPNELHGDYIIASRQLATKRQRQLLTGVSLALVVTVILAFVAFFQMLEANFQREQADFARATAVREADISSSISIASGAREINTYNQIEALALAQQAIQIEKPTSNVVRAFADIAFQPGAERILSEHTDYVRDVAFSPDGTQLASASEDTTIILWNVDTYDIQHTLEGHERDVTSVAFSPDGQTLASGSRDETIILWNTATGEKNRAIRRT
jgi:hypothetical protein